MDVNEQNLQAIAHIYDVTTDPSAWVSVLDELSRQVGALGTSLLVTDSTIQELTGLTVSTRIRAHAVTYQNDFYKKEAEFLSHVAQVVHKQRLSTAPEWVEQVAARGFPRHNLDEIEPFFRSVGIYHRFASPLNFHPTFFDIVTFHFGQRDKRSLAPDLHIAHWFLPHLAKASEIGRPFRLLEARFRAVLEVLDRFHLGVIMLSHNGHIVIDNWAAQRQFDTADGLQKTTQKKLVAQDRDANLALQKALKNALSLPSLNHSSSAQQLVINRPAGASPLLLEVSPLRNEEIGINTPLSGALVIVVDPDDHRIVDTTGLSALFGLSHAEQQVCDLLVSGYDTHDMAATRNTSPETIRNQVKSLLQKTNTHRRAELVRLALSINLPVDTPDNTPD